MARILLIDDSATVKAAVCRALAADNHTVTRTQDFIDLPFLLQHRPIDLILLDLHMPGYSGVALGEFLQRFTSSRIPIVIYSERPMKELHAAAKQIGAVAALSKSGSADELRGVINDILDRTSTVRAAR